MAAVFALGSLTFPSSQQPTEGDGVERVQPQTWSEFEPIGASAPGTLLTYLSSPSIKQTMTCYLDETNTALIITLFSARATVLWTTPWDATGYLVQITALSCKKERGTRGTGRWKTTFTIVKAA